MTVQLATIARDEIDVAGARRIIADMLDCEGGFRRVYAALCKWTWRVVIERRLDSELKAWHRLLLDTAARIANESTQCDSGAPPARLDPIGSAERLRAFADVIRLSAEAGSVSIIEEFVSRSHVVDILHVLLAGGAEPMRREAIKEKLGLGQANLSRVLTLLAANGLVERTAQGRYAVFALTYKGAKLARDPRESFADAKVTPTAGASPRTPEDQTSKHTNVFTKSMFESDPHHTVSIGKLSPGIGNKVTTQAHEQTYSISGLFTSADVASARKTNIAQPREVAL
jgi:DNA-binding HxlR family transcriptional regulator